MYIVWGIPAVILGILVLLRLPDWPREAHWLTPDERDALEQELTQEKEHHKQGHRHMTVLQALQHPQVLLLAAAYFFVVTASYGVEFFLPTILENWYDLPLRQSHLVPAHSSHRRADRAALGWLELGPH